MWQPAKRYFANKWTSLVILCTTCLCILVGGYTLYRRSIEDAVGGTTLSFMEQLADHDMRNVGSQFNGRLEYLRSLGNRLALLQEPEQIDLPYFLGVDAQASQFEKLYLITPKARFTTAPIWFRFWMNSPGAIHIGPKPVILLFAM